MRCSLRICFTNNGPTQSLNFRQGRRKLGVFLPIAGDKNKIPVISSPVRNFLVFKRVFFTDLVAKQVIRGKTGKNITLHVPPRQGGVARGSKGAHIYTLLANLPFFFLAGKRIFPSMPEKIQITDVFSLMPAQ